VEGTDADPNCNGDPLARGFINFCINKINKINSTPLKVSRNVFVFFLLRFYPEIVTIRPISTRHDAI